MSLGRSSGNLSRGVAFVVVPYALAAGLWIILSDTAMGLLFTDPDTLVRVSTAKGWLFVGVTTVLLYLLVRHLVKRLDLAHERELEYQRAQLRPSPMLLAIADTSNDAIFAKDESGRYMMINKAAAAFMGKPVSELLGRDDHAVFEPDEAIQIRSNDRRVYESGQVETHEEHVRTALGERVFLATKGPLRDTTGAVIGTFGISRDITERKAAEEAIRDGRQRLRTLVDNVPAALAIFDREMRYMELSGRWREANGIGHEEVTGRTFYAVNPATPEHWRDAHRRGMAGETVTCEEAWTDRTSGAAKWMRWSVRPWHDAGGEIAGVVVVSEDITSRKQAEDDLKRRNEDLARFNDAATDREIRMIELKRQVNALSSQLGRPAPYPLAFEAAPAAKPS